MNIFYRHPERVDRGTRTDARVRGRWPARILLALALALVPIFVIPGVASAATALERCRADTAPDVDIPFTQTANVYGVSFPAGPDPANAVFPGDAVRVVLGDGSKVTVDYGGDGGYGFAGKSEAAPLGYPFPGWNKYGVFFRWNNKPGGWIGGYDPHPLSDLASCQGAPGLPARFGTTMNDDNLGDNQGAFHFRLRIWHANPGPTSPALARCRSGAAPDVNVVFSHQSSTAGVNFPAGPDPDNGVFPGDAVKVVVTEGATARIGYWGDEAYDVDGKWEPATSGYPFPGWNKYGVFFRWNNKPGGWVDSFDPHSLRELGACSPAPGLPARFITAVNDDNLGDNQGTWTYRLMIWRR